MKKSFTLIEILVVIVIIGILSAFIIVGMSGVSQKATIAKGQAFANSLKNALLINLVSEWKFDELATATNGATIADTWSGGNNGTLSTGDANDKLRTGASCVSGKCLEFDGTNDYVNCGAGTNLDITGALAISVWVYPKTNSAFGGIVIKGGDDKFQLVARNDGYFEIYVENSSGTGQALSTVPITVNAWQHLAAIFNPTAQYLYLYKNGAETKVSCTIGSLRSNSTDFYIGRYSVYYFNGLVDEVRIYNAAVSASQIQQDYFLGLNNLFRVGEIAESEYLENVLEFKQSLANNN
ncbi:MAG: LamG domain-containing protein [Candidatus Pacebacteria bacterium]|nr:LamG domain-containing protein [Candidatus Paceibacterota bacterium]